MKVKEFLLWITIIAVIGITCWEVYRFFRISEHFNKLYQKVEVLEVESKTEASPDQTKLTGKTIVMFGDSIYYPMTEGKTIPQNIQELTEANVYGVAFGGCRMSIHDKYWDAFSMYNIADAIVTNDFTLQNEAITEMEKGNVNGMPLDFKNTLELIKSIDFNDVDYITIGYGTNDYTAGKALENSSDYEDVNTYAGALRHSLKTIMGAYPHLKILILTPTYRFWDVDGKYDKDSDSLYFNEQKDTLDKFVDEAKIISKEFKIPALDLYNELGINRYNRLYYIDTADGTHHNENGKVRISEIIASALLSQY
ncbi:MAG: hypothetical protein K0S04_341 [Herbinix sp.]|jgi:lysophospholipase L1-like esterase|nr:hypothetical protein [Herbinix sp.]